MSDEYSQKSQKEHDNKSANRKNRAFASRNRFWMPYCMVLVTVWVALGSLLSGCGTCGGSGPKESTVDNVASDGFVWGTVDPQSLDPAKVQDMAAWWVTVNLFEGLMVFAPGNTKPLPGVAKSEPTVGPDGLTWTFELRTEAKWSDGQPVVAEDFVYAWRRAVHPETGGKNAMDFVPIQNADAIINGSQPDVTQLGVHAKSQHVLEVRLAYPSPTFARIVATPAFFPVPKRAVDKFGDQWTRPENLIGNGAFMLAEWKPRDRMTFVKNPHYWDATNVALERSTMRHLDSEALAWNLYQDNQLHWLNLLPVEKVGRLRSENHPELHVDPTLCNATVHLNMQRTPFTDRRVRQAFTMAVDRERLVNHILNRGDSLATHYLPPVFEATFGYVSPKGPAFDPVEAKRLLAEAGYPGGTGFPSVTYIYNTYDLNRTVAEFLQRSLSENLGVNIALENMEWRTFLGRIQDNDFDLARGGGCGIEDPNEWVRNYRTGSPTNYVRFSNAAYDGLLERINRTADPAERNRVIAEAEALLVAENPAIPLYFPVRAYLLKPFVKGFEPQALDVHLLKYIRLLPSDSPTESRHAR